MCEWTTHTKNISKSNNAIIIETKKVTPIVENNVLVSGTTRLVDINTSSEEFNVMAHLGQEK